MLIICQSLAWFDMVVCAGCHVLVSFANRSVHSFSFFFGAGIAMGAKRLGEPG